MEPTIQEGEIILSVKTKHFKQGDIVAFYYNNKVLVKRVIALPGEWVNIDANGNVYVNNTKLNEPYISKKSIGIYDIEFPYQVPENKFFVMGDHRATSVDSRSSSVGCVEAEQLVGKIVFRVWPIKRIGIAK